MSVTLSGLLEASGATARQVDYWTRNGWLRPDRASLGPGHPRTWPDSEIVVLRIAVGLVAVGITPPQAISFARSLAAGSHVQLTDTARLVMT